MLLLKRDIVCLNTIFVFSCKTCLLPIITRIYLFETAIEYVIVADNNAVV